MPQIIYGRRPVLEALRGDAGVERLLIARGSTPKGALSEILDLARACQVPIDWVERSRLDEFGPHHQGVVAEVEAFEYADLDDCLAVAERRGEAALLLALDAIQDVQNLGSLIRTAEAVGAHGVILPRHRAAGVTPAVRKASAGAIEHLPVVQVTNLAQTLRGLKQGGLWVYGLDMAGERVYDQVDWTIPVVVVVGSEGRGLGRLVRETCDLLIQLPMRGQVASLNAAVAGSIVLYAAWRSRQWFDRVSPTTDSPASRELPRDR
jgi:23S rRNA (guanosine2251-2'-O)-methyltransferase